MIPLHDDNPTHSRPIVTYLLIAANVVVFLLQQAGGDLFTYHFALFPAALTRDWALVYRGQQVNLEPAWATIFTSMFLHGSWLHLGSNMLYLWIFGNNVEDTLGRIRFLVFYLIGGAAAAGLHILTGPGSQVPTVGASGAIAAVLGGYIVLFPHARVTTLVPIFIIMQVMELPASVVLGFWFLVQLFNGLMGLGMQVGAGGRAAGGGVAFWAHIGGFIAGYVLVRLFVKPRREPPRYRRPSFIEP
jgi:membrane associated rhomboid family serine protease